jgi:GTP-binding protein
MTHYDFHQTQFITSAAEWHHLLNHSGIEIAFAGRSNAGKSSAINTITGLSKLAKTSKMPGRTQLINYFQLASACYLVDLPGYGYAKVPESVRERVQRILSRYILEREPLRGLILVMDSRHPLKENDQIIIEWALQRQISLRLLLTKADKLSHRQGQETKRMVEKTFAGSNNTISVQLFSSLKKQGIEEARAWIEETFDDRNAN